MGYCLKYASGALFMALICSSPAWALGTMPDKPQNVSVRLGAEFASGNYGTDSTTRSIYLPLVATWSLNERLDAGIEVPFVYQSSSNVTTGLYRNTRAATLAKTAARGGPGYVGGSGGEQSSVYGLGDVILRLGAIAVFEGERTPQLRPSLLVKCPTADSSKALGTGEFDVGAGIDASKWFGDTLLTGEAFYTYQGKGDGLGLKNYFSFTTGVGYQLTEKVHPMLVVKGATAPSTYSGALLEARARLLWSLTGTTSLDLFVSRGIADSSPEYGVGIAAIYSF